MQNSHNIGYIGILPRQISSSSYLNQRANAMTIFLYKNLQIFVCVKVSYLHQPTAQRIFSIALYCMALYCIRACVELFFLQISIAMTLGINSWYSETFTVAKEQTKLSRLDNMSPICYIRCTYFPFMSLCSTLLVHPFESPFTSLHQS